MVLWLVASNSISLLATQCQCNQSGLLLLTRHGVLIHVSDNTPTATNIKHASGVNQAHCYQLSEFTSLMPVKSANIPIINVFISVVDLIAYQYSYQ